MTTQKKRPAKRVGDQEKKPTSSIVPVETRSIPWSVRLMLAVRAGGRCEFDGCNKYLLEHPLTFTMGNYAEAAHIVAFKPDGPRGSEGERPVKINDVENLMFLSANCHKEIDDHPARYPVATLRKYKKAHEDRIRLVTGLHDSGRTAVLVVKALIGGHSVSIPFEHVVQATAPRYPSSHDPCVIDLTTISDEGPEFLKVACRTIEDQLNRFFGSGGEGRRIGHASVFALAPIPVLIFLGNKMSNKIPLDLFQRHRDTEHWSWKDGEGTARYAVRRVRAGKPGKVALILSLSGTVRAGDLPAEMGTATVYAITLAGQVPSTTFLSTKSDLDAFRQAFQEAMGLVLQEHGKLAAIDLFPAVPAPVAVLVGRDLLPKAHPAVRVWDFDKAKGGFTYKLEVN